MVVERRLGYSEARQRGFSRLRAFRGAWEELPWGSHTTDGSLSVIDEDTVQVRENILPISRTAWPIDSIETYRGSAINKLPSLRWRGDPQRVEPSVARDSEVYIPENYKELDVARDRRIARRYRDLID